MRRWAVLVAVLIGLGIADLAVGQSRYYPRRPTFSPWLNLFRRDVGPFDPYNSIIRPTYQLQDAFRQVDRAIRQQSQRLTQVERGTLTLRYPEVAPTGTGSTFMNYSHFYPSLGGTASHTAPRRSRTSSRLPSLGLRGGYGLGGLSGIGSFIGY